MRISTIETDPGFRTFEILSMGNVVVHPIINGVRGRMALTVDTTKGFAVVLAVDDYEKPIPTPWGFRREMICNADVAVDLVRTTVGPAGDDS